MFQEFRDSVAYLDIETTGLDYYAHHITTIAIYDGKTIRHYVRGHNLNDFANDITNYKLLITYNGKCFDVPFIENAFGITLNQAHIDLRYVLRSLGYSGGLKGCERQLGIDRDDLDGIDGYFAVVLWCEYEQYKNHQALDTLLAYNIQDVLNLETLMTIAYNTNLKYTPFYNELILSDPNQPRNPFSADKKTVKRLMRKYSWLTY